MRRAIILTLLGIQLTGTAQAAPLGRIQPAQHVTCPTFLPAGTAGEAKPMAGWKLLMPQEIRVSGGGLLHGPLDGEAYLKPSVHQTKKNAGMTTETDTWELGQPHAFETWLYCQYGAGLQLFKKVEPYAASCTATGKRTMGGLDELVFVCK